MEVNNDITQAIEILDRLADLWEEYSELCLLKAEQIASDVHKD